MKPTLVILAAGMASRFGRLKQIEGLGPSGETIIDYSIYDAIQAGFGKVVMVIREATHAHFAETFTKKYGQKIRMVFVDQELHHLPAGFSVPAERSKPWGTGHALLMAKSVINEPFVVINGDDFYGREAFVDMVNHLSCHETSEDFCMIGYALGKTLSDFGSVSRGVCTVDAQQHLLKVEEMLSITRIDGNIISSGPDGDFPLAEDAQVSMNFWGFRPEHFSVLEKGFVDFLKAQGQALRSEYYIPTLADLLMQEGKSCQVLRSDAQWFGITYTEDVENAKERLKALVEQGIYPSPLS